MQYNKQRRLILKNSIAILILIFLTLLNHIDAQTFDPAEINKVCENGVVIVETNFGIGTGFFISSDGWIVTNYHVINEAYSSINYSPIKIKLKTGAFLYVDSIDVIKEYEDLDIALLKVNYSPKTILPLLDSNNIVGEKVIAIGHPNYDYWNVSDGIISKLNTEEKFLIQHSTPTDEGNSGGPLINMKGQVVAVVTAYKKMIDGQGYVKTQETGKRATDIKWVKLILDKRKIEYSTMPIVMSGISSRQMEELDLKKEREKLDKYKTKLEEQENLIKEKSIELDIRLSKSTQIIENAERIKEEIDNEKNRLSKLKYELTQRENTIIDNEKWVKEKENAIYRRMDNRIALELNLQAGVLQSELNLLNKRLIDVAFTTGMYYKYNINNSYNTSDRIGLSYRLTKIVDYRDQIEFKLLHELGVAIEFSSVFRLTVGSSIKLDEKIWNNKDNYFSKIDVNLNKYPYPIFIYTGFRTDNKLNEFQYFGGISAGITFDFFKW